jgi:hypothetical protein
MEEPQESRDLASFVGHIVGEEPLRVDESLGNGFVRLRVSEAERRQAKQDISCVEDAVVELLRNARDAHALNVLVATSREGDRRSFTVLDDGDGIPAAMHERVFEARVTSRLDTMHIDEWGVHGRGMALYSIKENARTAAVVASAPGRGTAVGVSFDAADPGERADQSTWPVLDPRADDADGEGRLRGPHNIARTCVEFALASAGVPGVYLGTPTEVLATLVALDGLAAKGTVPHRAGSRPLWEGLSSLTDARELLGRARELGLAVSERTAYRIVAGDIGPLEPLHLRYSGRRAREAAPRSVDLVRDRRGFKVAREDLDDFSDALKGAFSLLGERYYVGLRGEPRVRVTRDAVTVTFELDKDPELG